MNRVGAIKFFENVGILVVLVFLIGIGSMIYFNVQKSSILKEFSRIADLRSTDIAIRSFYIPELDCSLKGIKTPTCYDKLKLEEFSKILTRQDPGIFYFPVFGNSKITVKELFTKPEEWTLYNRPPAEFSDTISLRSPVLLLDPVLEEYSFGVIEVQKYVKRTV